MRMSAIRLVGRLLVYLRWRAMLQLYELNPGLKEKEAPRKPNLSSPTHHHTTPFMSFRPVRTTFALLTVRSAST